MLREESASLQPCGPGLRAFQATISSLRGMAGPARSLSISTMRFLLSTNTTLGLVLASFLDVHIAEGRR